MTARIPLALVLGLSLLAGGACRSQSAEVAEQVAASVRKDQSETTSTTEAKPELAPRKRSCAQEVGATLGPRYEALAAPLCAEWLERKLPGVALAIVEPGAEPIHVELGWRCFGAPESVGPETLFRLGSVSKSLTAAMVCGAIAEGHLALETKASTLPDFVDQPGTPTPTVAGLLGHRSGLGDIVPERLVEHEGAWLPALAASPSAGAVGEFHYSNTGYSLLGALVEEAFDQPYAELVDVRLASPTELGRLSAWTSPLPEDAACGHLERDADRHPIRIDEDLDFMPGDPGWMSPAGGVLASASDLARFALEIGGEALPGTAAMLEPGEPLPEAQRKARREDERYGAGLRSWALADGARAYGHSGNNEAFAAELLFVPGRRAIVLLSNCGAGLPATSLAAERLLEGA